MQKKVVEGGVVWGDLFFMAGCCNIADTVEEEIRVSMDELGDILNRHGLGFEHVLRATVYLRDIHDRERCLNRIWSEYFPENPPARTCIETGIGKTRFEVEFIVGIPDGREL